MKTETSHMRHGCWHFLLLLFQVWVAAGQAYGQQPTWYLLSREEGCIALDVLVRMERLPKSPDSPEDFVQMMRKLGHKVSVGSLPDTPPELIGKVVEVKIENGKSPVFVREEVCRVMEKRQ